MTTTSAMTPSTSTVTTLAKYAYTRVANYCIAPTIDVEILPFDKRCATCGHSIVWDNDLKPWGGYVHVCDVLLSRRTDAEDAQRYYRRHPELTDGHVVRARPWCVYCHTDDPAHLAYVETAWSNETRCSRCGGVEGYGIGD